MSIRCWLPLFVGIPLLLAGCGEQDDISQYTVPKPHVLLEANHVDREDGGSSPASTAAVPSRTLAALVPKGEQTWFFKMTGPDEAVRARTDEFLTLVRSIKFKADKPAWTLPAGWTEEPGSQFRLATLVAGSGADRLETTIIPLPSAEGDEGEYILANINRWRNQLGQPDITADDLEAQTTRIELTGGETAVVTTITGTASGAAPMAPFAGGGVAPFASSPPPTAPPPEASPLTFDVPEGWTPGRVGGLRKAAYTISGDGQKAELTVIDMTADAAELEPNINRWRQQIGLEAASKEDILAAIEDIDVAGGTGKLVELVGPKDAPQPQTILGVILVRDDKSWFFKLQGDSELARQETENFRKFVRSVKFGPADGAGNGK